MAELLYKSLVAGGALFIEQPTTPRSRIEQSLRRSERDYGLDPCSIARELVFPASALAEFRDREERFLRIAMPGVDWLHEQIGGLGYCTLLTDVSGTALELRAATRLEREFSSCGLRLGASWSEKDQGTCGVGTAIIDGAPTLVREREHFLIQNQGISCSAIPVFSPSEQILGVLNTTAISTHAEHRSLSVAYNLTLQTAARIERAYFSDEYASAWIMRLCGQPDEWSSDNGVLIAFDEAGRIAGMSRQLKHQIGIESMRRIRCIEDLLDVTSERLISHAHASPGAPIILHGGGDKPLLHAYLRAPRKTSRSAAPVRPTYEGFGGLAVSDPKLLENIARLKRLANSKVPILLLGETGSGKESFAKAIHEYSERRKRPFIAINCAAIPETLIESELFGYKEGAFTGAKSKGCPGKISLADGGTLFLDEIGDMPLALQTRLLRVLAEGEVLALGATTPLHVDISVICATHRDLPQMVQEKTFREDLYYRLNAATFRLPPLRERADIVEVVHRVFVEEAQSHSRRLVLAKDVEEILCAHRWPGNIRELRNVLRFAIAVCAGDEVRAEHLPETFAIRTPETRFVRQRGEITRHRNDHEYCERAVLINALRRANWNASAASKSLGISRSTLYRKIKEHNIVSPNSADATAQDR